MKELTALLLKCQPAIVLVALFYGIIAAWLAMADLIPIMKQIWSPAGKAQAVGIVAGCLSLVVMAIQRAK